MQHPEIKIMERAIAIAQQNRAKGGSPIAAIVVKDDEIIAEAVTTIVENKDATCHAEINAIRLASQKLESLFLEDCYLYSTYEPCPMCSSAAIWAKMKGIVYGASREDQTPSQLWRVNISAEEILKNSTPVLELHRDFMRAECRELLSL